ncbi:unnamed protein product [Arabidopsis arenosa]|uniref:Uncharacterized protein n=1 Tax=Arabidopsis arenosa TaxID=38785 RepID=A0A8S2AHA9_ARAAE|nr:unnamed protein product [Arabidopsis arenosa]
MLKQFPSIDDDRKPLQEKDACDVGGMSPHLYNLYFTGLVRDDSLAVFEVAICWQKDNLLLQLNGPIHGSNITILEAELTTLKLGLTRISIYCDYYPIYHFTKGLTYFAVEKNMFSSFQEIIRGYNLSQFGDPDLQALLLLDADPGA